MGKILQFLSRMVDSLSDSVHNVLSLPGIVPGRVFPGCFSRGYKMSIVETIRNVQKMVFAARKSAQQVIASRDHSLVAELRESLLNAIEVEPSMLKRLGIAPKVIAVPGPKIDGVRKIEKREVGKSLAQLLAEVAKETAEDRARELEMQDILARVADYAIQFENCQNPDTFEIRFRPVVPRMIRKLKNDSSPLV